jgi:uncharacterized protein YndB with AHSA1/START domain
MIELVFEAEIDCTPETIFELISDLRGQDRWLAHSVWFRGTTDISSNPATLGTTYREPSPFGVRNGVVTEFDPPTKITFHQPTTSRLGLATIDAVVRYTLAPRAGSTRITRTLTLGFPWYLKPLQPVLRRAFRGENARTLRALTAQIGMGSPPRA